MTLSRTLIALVALGASNPAFADTECTDPIAAWKPTELLRQEFEQDGRTVQRIKVGDGCYEVRGVDRMGNRIKAKYSPASFRIRSLEVEFGPAGVASDYLRSRQHNANRGEQSGQPTPRNVP